MTFSNDNANPRTVHSKAYAPEGHGAYERFNRTVNEVIETEALSLDEFVSLDEVNAYFEAWLAERYHQVVRMRTKGGNTP